MSLLLNTGERGLLVGMTGSGKTQNALFQIEAATQWPKIIFDTKIEPKFQTLPHSHEKMWLVESVSKLQEISKRKAAEWPDYILVRPHEKELLDFDLMNDYSQIVYHRFGKCLIYFDELYQWHARGQPVEGIQGLLTRGRSKGKTVLMGTQKPVWISRFCFSESQKFYCHYLGDRRDRETLDNIAPDFSRYPLLPKFHFYFYETGKDRAELYSPVPLINNNSSGEISSREWI